MKLTEHIDSVLRLMDCGAPYDDIRSSLRAVYEQAQAEETAAAERAEVYRKQERKGLDMN